MPPDAAPPPEAAEPRSAGPPEPARPAEAASPGLLGRLPEPVRAATAWSAAALTSAGALAVVLLLCWSFRAAAVPALIAVLATALLEPVARRAVRGGRSRAFGAALACLVLIVVIDGTIWMVAKALIDAAPSIGAALAQVGDRLGAGDLGSLGQNAASGVSELGSQLASTLLSGVVKGVGLAAQLVTAAVLCLALTFFLLRDADRIPGLIRGWVPAAHAEQAVRLTRLAYRAMSGYMRGTTLIALIDAGLILVGLLLLRVPDALGLAALVFVGAYVPFVGAFLSGLVAVLVALGDRGFVVALGTLAVILAVQFVEGAFLQPIIQSRTVSMHPAVVMVAVTAGGSVAGILGALLAVPFTAAAVAIVTELRGD
ncbi:AI-2E family transporter [Streptacidiphilus sp. N1-12]|uniref:AI-2E family transporter n=2 Tax=Streptacidiphilus alkalitolerans TaxID=3342712 RepID=A0ABV6WFE4_9ACTN